MKAAMRSLQLFLAAVIGFCAAMPDWIKIWAGTHDVYAGLWGIEGGTRWDDARDDLDIFGVAYVAFAITIAGVVMLVRAAIVQKPPAIASARKAMIATAIAMGVFLLRMLIEKGVGLDWVGVVGPLAALAAIATVRK